MAPRKRKNNQAHRGHEAAADSRMMTMAIKPEPMEQQPEEEGSVVVKQEPLDPVVKQEPLDPVVKQEPLDPVVKQEPLDPVVKQEPLDPQEQFNATIKTEPIEGEAMDAEEPEELVLISPFEVKQEPVEPDDPRHPDYSPASDANEADDTNQDHDNHIQEDASDEDCIEQFDIQGLRLAEFTGVTVHRRDLYIGTRFHNYGQVKFLSADDLCRHFPEALFSFLSAFADAPLEMEVIVPATSQPSRRGEIKDREQLNEPTSKKKRKRNADAP